MSCRFALFVVGLSVFVGAFAAGCGPEPIFDDDIGIAAIPIDAGSAEGTFALKVVNTTLVQVPVLGDFAGGGTNYRLVRRVFDEDENHYVQESTLCGGFNVEVAGVTTSVPESTYRAVAPNTAEIVEIDDDGAYRQRDHIQLWGLRNLPEPFTTPLPANKEEAQEAPHRDRIFDMDNDDNDGITSIVSGAVAGEVYVIQRKTVTTRGIVLGPDRMLGLSVNTNELVQLGNTNPLLDRQSEGSAAAHPDPKRSWFEEVRVDDGFDCDDVMAAEDDGILSRNRPF
jgi:hypothetical protein